MAALRFKIGDFVWFGEDLIFVASKNYGVKVAHTTIFIPGVSTQPATTSWRISKKIPYQSIPENMELNWGWHPISKSWPHKIPDDMPIEVARFVMKAVFFLSDKE